MLGLFGVQGRSCTSCSGQQLGQFAVYALYSMNSQVVRVRLRAPVIDADSGPPGSFRSVIQVSRVGSGNLEESGLGCRVTPDDAYLKARPARSGQA